MANLRLPPRPGSRPTVMCTGYSLHFFDAGVGQRGSDKFYHGFYYRADSDGTYRVVTHWGRDGAVGQHKVDTFATERDAVKLLDKKRTEKMRHGYEKLGEGAQPVEIDGRDLAQSAFRFAELIAHREPDKTRMTGGILIQEEPDLMDFLG